MNNIDVASAVSTVKNSNYNIYKVTPQHLIGDNIPWTNFSSKCCPACNDRNKLPGEYCIWCDTDNSSSPNMNKELKLNTFSVKPCKISTGINRVRK